jgi:lipopolysaccharide transport system ATP-binding protein
MSDIAIRVNGLSKQYRIGAKQERTTRLGEVITKALSSPIEGIRNLWRPVSEDELIWALRGISFEAHEGETIGIIGRNGAGKSTLLKILARITNPTEGRAELYGRVGALLEVGTGFHQELTGRENIYLKGAMLGMKRHEITRKLDDIVQFAEIGAFIDTPVKRFSSGMGMRLAFAVSAHLDAEVMIVDEVLAVGDIAFQNKCLGKMDEVTQTGRTVLFVSHNMSSINRLCGRTLWMDNGQIVMDGETSQVIEGYLTANSSQEGSRIWPEGFSNRGVDDFKVRAIRIVSQQGAVTSSLSILDPFTVEIDYEVRKKLPFARVGFQIATTSGVVVFETYDADNDAYSGAVQQGHYTARCEVPAPLLNSGYYFINLNAGIPRMRSLAKAEGVLTCEVVDVGAQGAYMSVGRGGLIRANFKWTREKTGKHAAQH